MFSNTTRSFLKDLGVLLQLPGYLCLPTFVVIVIFKEWHALMPFAILTLISFGLGQLLYRSFKNNNKTKTGSSYAVVSLAWLLIPLMGSIPFYGMSHLITEANDQLAIFSSFHSAFFESMSGFTGTGLTMLEDSSKIPHSLQWWRSISEWLGGLGIIFLAVMILDTAHQSEKLYQSEAMSWKSRNQDTKGKIKKIWSIYLFYTGLSVFVFYLLGMPLWEAINHGFTGISTGGFSVTKDSFISYGNNIKWAAAGIMLLGTFSFKIHVLAMERKFKALWMDTQFRYFIAILILIILLLLTLNRNLSMVDIIFQAASALGTCGFNSVDISSYTSMLFFPLILAMFLGGNSSSTTGGLKTGRVAWLLKAIGDQLKHTLGKKGNEYESQIYYDGHKVESKKAFKRIRLAGTLLFCWLTAIAMGAIILMLLLNTEYSFMQIIFEVNSALNNVGLSSGLTGHHLPAAVKWTLSILMWLGRLEIMGILIMFSFFFKNFS